MRDIIAKITEGDDAAFEQMVQAIASGVIYVFAQKEDEEGLTLNFLNYLLEDDQSIEYIPIFSDEQEVDEFVEDADVPEGYELYEFEGDLFSDLVDDEQFIMANPVSGGIVFQGAHLKNISNQS